ncbi:hypothetical protein M404DRAFT_37569, partial [Pisolithus tinctorius Marx 270]
NLELTFPLQLLTPIKDFTAHEQVDRVRFLSALHIFSIRKCQYTRVVLEPPGVGSGACKPGAVNSRLLTSAEANDRAVFGIPNTVGLGVFEGKGSNKYI